jgi:hypothetical protein
MAQQEETPRRGGGRDENLEEMGEGAHQHSSGTFPYVQHISGYIDSYLLLGKIGHQIFIVANRLAKKPRAIYSA